MSTRPEEPRDQDESDGSTTEELMHGDMREVEEQAGHTGDAPAKLDGERPDPPAEDPGH